MNVMLSKFLVIDFVGTGKVKFFSWLSRLYTETPMEHRDPNNPWFYLEEKEYQLMVDLFLSTEEGYAKNRRVVFDPETRHVEIHIEALIPVESLIYSHWKEDIGERLISQHKEAKYRPTAWMVDSRLMAVDVLVNKTNSFATFQFPLPRDWVLPWLFPVFILSEYEAGRGITHNGEYGVVDTEQAMGFFNDLHRNCTLKAVEFVLAKESLERYDFKIMSQLGDPFFCGAFPLIKMGFPETRCTSIAEPFFEHEVLDLWYRATRPVRLRSAQKS